MGNLLIYQSLVLARHRLLHSADCMACVSASPSGPMIHLRSRTFRMPCHWSTWWLLTCRATGKSQWRELIDALSTRFVAPAFLVKRAWWMSATSKVLNCASPLCQSRHKAELLTKPCLEGSSLFVPADFFLISAQSKKNLGLRDSKSPGLCSMLFFGA